MKIINHIYPIGLQYKATTGVRPVTYETGSANQRGDNQPAGLVTMWLMVEVFDAQHLFKEFILPI